MTPEPSEDALPAYMERLSAIVGAEFDRMPAHLVAEGLALMDMDPSMPRGTVLHSSGDGWLHATWAGRHLASVRWSDLLADDADAPDVGQSS